MDVFLKTSQKQHVFASQKLIFGISLYRQAIKNILKKAKSNHLATSGSVSFSCQFSFYIISLFSFFVRIVIPESFLTSQVFLTPIIFFSSLSFLFSLTISHHSGVSMRSCEGTDDNKESFFFFLFFSHFSQKYKDLYRKKVGF